MFYLFNEGGKINFFNFLVLFSISDFFFDLSLFLIGEGTRWIDVCQSNGNLLASGGGNMAVKIFDKREAKIVQTFDGIHKGSIF